MHSITAGAEASALLNRHFAPSPRPRTTRQGRPANLTAPLLCLLLLLLPGVLSAPHPARAETIGTFVLASGTIGAASYSGISSSSHDVVRLEVHPPSPPAVDNTLTNLGTIAAEQTGNGYAYGVRLLEDSSLDNGGLIKATTNTGNARGVTIAGDGTDVINSGTISAYGDRAIGLVNYNNDASASFLNTANGVIQALSTNDDATAVDMSGGTFTNKGTIASSQVGILVRSANASFINTGTIAAGPDGWLAISASGGATVTLGTGTRIMTTRHIDPDNPANNIYEAGGGGIWGTNANLVLDGTGTADFYIMGTWSTLKKTGTGIWTVEKSISAALGAVSVNQGTLAFSRGVTASMDSLTLDAGATLQLAADGQGTAGITVTNTADLNGTLLVDPSAATVGKSTLLKAGTLKTTGMSLASTNPDFDLSRISTAGNKLMVTTTFAPKTDAPSQGLLSSVTDVQSFAEVAQSRTITLLDPLTTDLSADSGERGPVMLADNSDSLAGLFAPRDEPQWRVFLQPVTSFGSREAQGESSGYDSSLLGVELGADRKLGEHWLVGGYLGYGTSIIDFDNTSATVDNREEQEMTTLGLYTGYRCGNWMLGDTLSGTWVNHDMKRYAGLNETATSDYESLVLRNQLLALYNLDLGDGWNLTPRAGLNLTHVHREGFDESGAANAVSYDDLDKTFVDLALGARLSRSFEVGGATIAPYAGLGLTQALTDGDVTVRQYLSSTSAEVTTDNDDTRLTPELGLVLSRDRASLTFGYTGEFSEHAQNSTLSAMLRWAF